jgi:hypothetical protein
MINAIDYFNAKTQALCMFQKVVLFNLESTGYYDEEPRGPGDFGGEGGVSGRCTCDKGEGFASGDFRLKVCRRDASGGSKGIDVFLGEPCTGEDGAEEYPYG